MTVEQLAAAYGIARQRVYQICAKRNLVKSDFLQPGAILEKLLASGVSSKLRTRLSNPRTRAEIERKLSNLQKKS